MYATCLVKVDRHKDKGQQCQQLRVSFHIMMPTTQMEKSGMPSEGIEQYKM